MNLGLHLTRVSIDAGAQHPNKMKFKGILVRLDEPSTKPPNGSAGHRIFVPSDVAKKRLPSLIGMGLNYAPGLDGHSQRRKVGVITDAGIRGKDLWVTGHVWKHDFPEAEKDLKQDDLGMSMELGEVRVDDPHADVWALNDFQFLGATILWRNSAAYNRTQAIAARAERRGSMATSKTKKVTKKAPTVADIAAQAAAGAVKASTRSIVKAIRAQNEILGTIAASQEDMDARLTALEAGSGDLGAAASSGSEEIEAAGKGKATSSSSASSATSTSSEDDDKMEGAGGDASSSSEEEMEGTGDDVGDLEKHESASSDSEPGHANEDAKNRGEDGAADLVKKVGKTVASSREKALRKQLKATQEKLAASHQVVKTLNKRVEKVEAQVSKATKTIGRRSLPPEVTSLLAKANIDATDLLRTGTKMTVAEVDGVLNASGLNLNSVDRVALKNSFRANGLMDEGAVDRGNRR